MNEPNRPIDLAAQTCTPCKGGVPPLKGKPLMRLQQQMPGWQVVEEHHLVKEYTFKDFVSALAFVTQVGRIAEQQGHHPWIHFTWGKVRIEIWTHKIDGLTESDFILAAKIDRITPNATS